MATMAAGAMGLAAHGVAHRSGKTTEPLLLGFFVFIIGSIKVCQVIAKYINCYYQFSTMILTALFFPLSYFWFSAMVTALWSWCGYVRKVFFSRNEDRVWLWASSFQSDFLLGVYLGLPRDWGSQDGLPEGFDSHLWQLNGNGCVLVHLPCLVWEWASHFDCIQRGESRRLLGRYVLLVFWDGFKCQRNNQIVPRPSMKNRLYNL